MDFRPFDLIGLGATGKAVGRVRDIRKKTKQNQNPTTHENIQTEQCWQNRDATGVFQV